MATVSLCMIVKNEEENIANCLNSVKDIVDEIIIVDTGSADKTKEAAESICKSICKKFTSEGKLFEFKILDFKWNDDFSAARNESLKHATKDWILVLDADEILEQEGSKLIKELINDKENDAFLLLQKNYTNEASIAGFVNEPHNNEPYKKGSISYSGWYGSFIVRLFRNKKGYKFEGAVHELAEMSIESKKGRIAAADVILHHYGNADPDAARKKRQFYLELCKKKITEHPNASSYYELGVLYKENDCFNDALGCFKRAVELNPQNSRALYEIGVIHEKKNDYDLAIKNYLESLRARENSEAFQNLGVCYLKKGMLKESYRNLVKAMLLNPNKYTVYNNLGAVLEKLGNYDSAEQMLEIGIKLNPNNSIGFYNLGVVLDKKGGFENALKNYERAVELMHNKKEEIKKRIEQLKAILAANPKYRYHFNS